MITNQQFKKRNDIHWARKGWHIGGVTILALIWWTCPPTWSLLVFMSLWFIFVPADLIRLKWRPLNDWVLHIFSPLLREGEQERPSGLSFLISGVVVMACLFPPPVVLLTLFFLAYADPVASYFGIRYGKDRIFRNKSLQGSLAAFLVCSALTFWFLGTQNLYWDRWLILSLLGGLIGSLAELVPIGHLDDNFTIPLVSALGLWLLFSIFQLQLQW